MDLEAAVRPGSQPRPSLLIGGRYDECTPGHLGEMHARIRGSKLHTIEDASHLCFAEKPEEFNQVINAFLDQADSRPPVQ